MQRVRSSQPSRRAEAGGLSQNGLRDWQQFDVRSQQRQFVCLCQNHIILLQRPDQRFQEDPVATHNLDGLRLRRLSERVQKRSLNWMLLDAVDY